jgi:hypothetical protein
LIISSTDSGNKRTWRQCTQWILSSIRHLLWRWWTNCRCWFKESESFDIFSNARIFMGCWNSSIVP